MILLVCFGSGIGIFTCFSTLLEQILCVKGYSNVSQNTSNYSFVGFSQEASFVWSRDFGLGMFSIAK